MTKFKASVLFISLILIISTTALGIQDLVFQPSSGRQVSLKSQSDSQTGTILLPRISSVNQQLTLLDRDTANVTVTAPIIGGGKFGLNYSSIGLDKTAEFVWTGGHKWSGKFTPPYGGTLPATCTPSELFIKTSAPTGKRIYVCESTDTWVLEGDGTTTLGTGSLSNSYIPFIADDEVDGSANLTFVDGSPAVLSVIGNLAVGVSESEHAATITGVVSIASGSLPESEPDTSQGYGLFLGTDSLSSGESRILTYNPSGSTYLSFWTNSASGDEAVERARFDSTGQFTLMPMSVSSTHDLRFRELASNGSNYVALKAPTSIASNFTLTLPSATPAGASSGFIKSTTGGTLSFVQPQFSDLGGTISVTQGGNGEAPTAADQLAVSTSTSDVDWISIGNCATALTYSTTTHTFGCGAGGGGASGTVTSVGLSVPSWLTVSGSPVTASGTITVAATPQPNNLVFAGPAAAPSATPSFRALVNDDLPTITSTNKVNWTAVNKTGSNLGDLGPELDSVLYASLSSITGAGSVVYCSDCSRTNPCTGSGSGAMARLLAGSTWDCGNGSVTSVAVAVPSWLSVSGSPVTTSGTVTVTSASQAQNYVFAGPIAAPSATPHFRALVNADLPSGIDAAKIGGGGVSTTEFDRLDGVTSSVQTQINNKVDGSTALTANVFLAGPSALPAATPSYRAMVTGDLPAGIPASKIAAGSVDDTEFSYLNGVTSSIQTQINAAGDVIAVGDCTTGTCFTQTGSGSIITSGGDNNLQLRSNKSVGVFLDIDGATVEKFFVRDNVYATPIFEVVEDLSVVLNNQATLKFTSDSATKYTGIKAPASVSASYDLTLPSATPAAANQALVTSAGGASPTLSWATVATTTGTETLTNKTLTAPRISSNSSINDANGYAVLAFPNASPSPTSTPVNYLTIKNALAGGKPSIEATGSDSNIGINLVPKNFGAVSVNDVNVALSSTSISPGTGLTGGGDISANRTLSFDYAPTISATPGTGKCVFSSSVGGLVCDNSTSYNVAIAVPTPLPTANITITMPNNTGTVLLKEDINTALGFAGIFDASQYTGGDFFGKIVFDTNPTLKGLTISTSTDGDDPFEKTYQFRLTTTNATATTLAEVTLTSDTANYLECKILGRRTGGTGGSANDSYAVWRAWHYIGDGTLVEAGASAGINVAPNSFSATGTPTFSSTTSAGKFVVQVAGILNNNITWHATCRHSSLGS